jgi:RNA polymerase sigma-70 factor, Bacteroides expansion family 1
MPDDFIVFKKIREGDIKTFEKVFRQFYSPLCIYASGITERNDISEEIVQDVFYNIWKDKENIHILSSLKNYLYGAVKNHSLRYREHLLVQERHQKYVWNYRSEDTDLSPQELLEYKELEGVVINILKELPERRVQIFNMHRMDGKKYKEIADFFSISVKTVEAEMTKTYQALKQGVKQYTLNNGI